MAIKDFSAGEVAKSRGTGYPGSRPSTTISTPNCASPLQLRSLPEAEIDCALVNGMRGINGSRTDGLHDDRVGGAVNWTDGMANGLDRLANGHSTFSNGDGGVTSPANASPEPIAIVGMGMRLPGGSHDPLAFWDFLVHKRDARKPIPKDRYDIEGFHAGSQKPGSMPFDHGYFIDVDLEKADAGFFNISKAEFEWLDPQQRLLLEVVYETFQNAGEVDWRGKNIGCFTGTFGEDWLTLQAQDTQDSGLYRITGSGDFVLANRISYEYDLRGPSMTIKVGCSSSLVALHLACEALHRGDCSSAIVGGTNILMSPHSTLAMIEHGALSPEASVKAFDAKADGYARAEAVNAIYIKKLDHAIRDGNPIRAVIRSTSSNSDGKTPGINTPSSEAHEALIRRAYEVAGLHDYSQTAMVECHGTGTLVGDPLETKAVANVFGEKGVYIGSVKPNVGHSEGASGLTSVIKSVLELEHKTIIPNIKFDNPNPKIPFKQGRLTVPTEPTPWPRDRCERISVNSFGIGGANAHAIIESAASMVGLTKLKQTRVGNTSPHSLLVFSANHLDSLQKIIKNYEKHINTQALTLNDLAYTLGARREHLPYRAFCVTDGKLFEASPLIKSGPPPPTVFVFNGQGAQWPEMGKDLILDYDSFRADIRAMDKCLSRLKIRPSWTIEDELLKPRAISSVEKAEFSQPLCTAIQIALVNLLRAWGVLPAAVVGHSSGEIAAAYAAGALTREDAIEIAYYRGFMATQRTRPGGMAAIGLGRADVTPFLVPGVMIACENSASSVTISGDVDQLDSVISKLKTDKPDILARRLRVEVAYHSHHMKGVGELYQSLIERDFMTRPLAIPFYSSVTGQIISKSGSLGPSYWRQNLESPVLFYDAVKSLLASSEKTNLFLELGPHSALAGPLRQIFKETKPATQYVSCLTRGSDCTASILKAMGQLYCLGVKIDFAAMNSGGVTLPDLPAYPWYHERGYWHESRLAKEYRFRRFPHHDLLGSRVAEGDDFEPSWRNILRLNSLSWLRDHAVCADVVFPAAGYVAIVGEAVRQLSGIGDYTVREVTISTALVLQDATPTEIITRLKPHRLTNVLDSPWYEFSIVSYSGAKWAKHCFGQVRAGPASKYHVPAIQDFPRHVPSTRWYQTMRKVGLDYGPAFTGLTAISAGIKEPTASAIIIDQPKFEESPYQLHPTTLDFLFQSLCVAAYNGQPRLFEKLSLPTYIKELYIGSRRREIKLNVSTHTGPGFVLTSNGHGVADGELVLYLKGMKLSPLQDQAVKSNANPHAAVQLEWKPDIDFVNAGDLLQPLPDFRADHQLLERLSLLCAIDNHSQIKSAPTACEHLEKYRCWIADRVERTKMDENALIPDAKTLLDLDSNQRQALIDSLMSESRASVTAPAATAIYQVYKSAIEVYEGRIDSLQVLLKENVLTELYDFLSLFHCKEFITLLSHSNPNLKILEIGAGTGGVTSNMLRDLKTELGERLYSTYTYTDVSSGFFPNAKERFMEYAGIEYAVLDISRDPIAQGFKAESYDLIIAANVLHATPKLNETLRNCRTLLHPRGRLFLQELCSESKWINYVMGGLPGWWLGEGDQRSHEPYISPERWDEELRSAGFAGIETYRLDQEAPYQIAANILARPTTVVATPSKRVTLLTDPEISSFSREVEALFISGGYKVDFCSLSQQPPSSQDIISLLDLDLDRSFLDAVSEQEFNSFVHFVENLQGCGLLWVTRAVQIECKDPRYALILGAARTIRSELSATFGTLELDNIEPHAWRSVFEVFQKFQLRAVQSDVSGLDSDNEFVLSNGFVNVGRYHGVSISQQLLRSSLDDSPKRLEISQRGLLHSLRWVQRPLGDLAPHEVELEVRAAGMNFKDVLRAMGVVDGLAIQGDTLGDECAGIVRRVGSDVHNLQVGDRVMAWTFGAFSTRVKAPSRLCVKIPDSLTFEGAATMPCVYVTVLQSLIEIGRLEADQTILVHSASGGIGFAAISIAQMIGAEIYVTVGTESKATFLMDSFNIPRDHIFYSRDSTFLDDIMRATNGRGVDLVLNSLSGELLHASWKCVAEYGIMVEIGKRDFIGQGQLAMDMFEANRGYYGVDVAAICLEKPAKTTRLLNRIMELYEQGLIKPIHPITIFDATAVEDAFRYLQKGQHIGKVVISLPRNPDDLPVAPVSRQLILRPDASYLLIGGLGGLGQSIAIWLAEHGARNLTFLSRSGRKNVDERFFEELKVLGCNAQIFEGSVANMDDVKKVVSNAAAPIMGVLQMSMVLRDGAFTQMSIDRWQTAISPKVQGTWNLHEVLGQAPLDFFVLFGSISGTVGQKGQANYAAANTFLDAFVQYRHGLGLPASVLDIGCVEDVGYVSANPQILDRMRASAIHTLSEKDLLESLQLIISRSAPPTLTPKPSCTEPYMNPGHIALGMRSTLPLSDSRTQAFWKKDRRMAVHKDLEYTCTPQSSTTDEALKQFLAIATMDPTKLCEKSSADFLAQQIGTRVLSFMMSSEAEPDTSLSLAVMGVDSLIAIEIRNWWRQNLCSEVSVLELLNGGSIQQLGRLAAERLRGKIEGSPLGEGDSSGA